MIKNVYIKNGLINTVFKILSAVNFLVKKDDKKILLYSDTTFRDNTRYLYEYLKENKYNEEYTIVCAVKDYRQYAQNQGENIYFVSPVMGVIKYLSCGHVFYSFGKIPIRPSKDQVVIQMWHGTSFKGFAENQRKTNKLRNNFYTYVYASSEYFRDIVAKKFAVNPENIVICGHPRTDMLYKKGLLYDFSAYKKMVIWLPTFRKSSELGMQDGNSNGIIPLVDDSDLVKLDCFLRRKNVLMIVKLHPEQDVSSVNEIEFTHLQLMTDQEFREKEYDLYALLKCADALITDYSSVFYDYLLLNRPIGFTEDDVEEYRDSRGFAVDDPDAFRPGMKMRTLNDLEQFVDDLIEGKDDYIQARRRINDLSNQYQDGNNCKRTLEISKIDLESGGGY
jgi:CDP-glycerol glycerophosphotransferase (TagB/SpsB family)